MAPEPQDVSAAERRMPPAPRAAVEIIRARGHVVAVREDRNGSLRYRVDGGREMTAHQMSTRFRHYGI
jgi:hypothetical protein